MRAAAFHGNRIRSDVFARRYFFKQCTQHQVYVCEKRAFAYLLRYETYVKDYSQALKMLSWLEANSPSFRAFLEEQNSEVHGYLTLPALLITPIQRLPKYELLLQVCLDYTPDHLATVATYSPQYKRTL